MNLDLILALHLITVDNSHDSQGSKDQLENGLRLGLKRY